MPHNANIECLRNYLSGYLRHSNLTSITARDDWQTLAQTELDRRAAKVLEAMTTEDLNLIASGQVNLPELAQQAVPS